MKKTFTLLFILISAGLITAQTATMKVVVLAQSGATLATVNNLDTLHYSVTAGSTKTLKFNYENLTSTTNTYSVMRYDVTLNTLASSAASPTAASAYFCFGNLGTCFPSSTTVCPVAEYDILAPNTVDQLVTDIDEASAQGYSMVRYKIYNVNNSADYTTFVVRYNEMFSGINELSSAIESASEVYPNPAGNNSNISVTLKRENDVKVQVYNALGALVYTSAPQKYAPGKHKISIDCSSYNSGLYFMNVVADGAKVTRRFVVNK